LSEKWDIPHLSTGEMLRKSARSGAGVGKEVKEAMDRGDLVPDQLVVAVVSERISQPDTERGFILDGFPRSGRCV
jgi:adenylate kinase